jgi:hypothetical protein
MTIHVRTTIYTAYPVEVVDDSDLDEDGNPNCLILSWDEAEDLAGKLFGAILTRRNGEPPSGVREPRRPIPSGFTPGEVIGFNRYAHVPDVQGRDVSP